MKKIAVITDDVEMNREILSDMLDDEFMIVEAGNGEEALKAVEDNIDNVAVLLLDLMMPVMDGFGVIAELKRRGLADRFPILVITADSAADTEDACLREGATDFITKPFNPSLVRRRVNNSVALYAYKNSLEEKVAEQTKELKAQAELLMIQNQKLADRNEETIELLGNVVEARNLESGTHVRRVKGFSMILTRKFSEMHPELNLSDEDIELFGSASVMHDLGKIMVSDGILLKPGKLTSEEFAEMKKHTVYGCKIIEDSRHMWEDKYYGLCLGVCRHHHEKWNGEGYPDGLKGNEIPLVAQIVSVADCFDALTTERPYKKPFTSDTAYSMILGGECGSFNPELMLCFEECREEFYRFAAETGGK